MSVGLFYLLSRFRLLTHTAAYSDQHIGLLLLETLQLSDIAVDLQLGVFTNGAGVEYYNIGGCHIIGNAAAHKTKLSFKLLPVADILLTAVAVYTAQGRSLSFGENIPYRLNVIYFHLCNAFRSINVILVISHSGKSLHSLVKIVRRHRLPVKHRIYGQLAAA